MIIGREFIDRHGVQQDQHLSGVDKIAHDEWVKTTSWNLTRYDLIRLSYFHGCMEQGSDGSPSERWPINGSNWSKSDVVYQSESGGTLTRAMVSEWLDNYGAFTHGFKRAMLYAEKHLNEQSSKIV